MIALKAFKIYWRLYKELIHEEHFEECSWYTTEKEEIYSR